MLQKATFIYSSDLADIAVGTEAGGLETRPIRSYKLNPIHSPQLARVLLFFVWSAGQTERTVSRSTHFIAGSRGGSIARLVARCARNPELDKGAKYAPIVGKVHFGIGASG